MNKSAEKQFSPTAETLPPPPMEKPQSQTPMSLNNINVNPPSHNARGKVDEIRFPVKTAIASSIASALLAGGIGYCVITGYNPFEKKASTSTGSASSASPSPDHSSDENNNLPTEVNTPEQLRQIIEAYKIKASPSDFMAASGKNNYFDALRFVPKLDEKGKPSDPLSYQWVPMDSSKFTNLQGDDIIIATMLKNERYINSLKNIGISPNAKYTEKENPLITYHYYRCVTPASPGIASIVIEEKSRRGSRNLSLFRLKLPVCQENNQPQNSPESASPGTK